MSRPSAYTIAVEGQDLEGDFEAPSPIRAAGIARREWGVEVGTTLVLTDRRGFTRFYQATETAVRISRLGGK